MSGKRAIPVPEKRRAIDKKKMVKITGASENNLQNLDVEFPMGVMTAVTGVSGSGKSTLVNSILKKSLAQKLNHNSEKPGKHKKITGYEGIERLIDIDQSPIGRTPRSNPATYTSVLMTFVIYLPIQMKQKFVVIKKDVSHLMLKVDVVKPVLVMESSKLKCISCRMFMFHVKFAMADVTIQKL